MTVYGQNVPSVVDDRRAALITSLGLTGSVGAALSVADLERQYNVNSLAAGQSPVIDGPWVSLIVTGDWTAVGGFPPEVMKDSRGWVHLRGRVQGGAASGATAFATLPVGYRLAPTAGYLFSRYTPSAIPTHTIISAPASNTLQGGYDTAGVGLANQLVDLSTCHSWPAGA